MLILPPRTRFCARFKTDPGTDRLMQATDVSAVTAMAASGIPGTACSTGAVMLTSDGNTAGPMNAWLVNLLNTFHLPDAAAFLAKNHQLAQTNAWVGAVGSLGITKAPSLYLQSRKEEKLKDPE